MAMLWSYYGKLRALKFNITSKRGVNNNKGKPHA